ncbi:HYR domain-containing protein, partial [Maritalea mobilis]
MAELQLNRNWVERAFLGVITTLLLSNSAMATSVTGITTTGARNATGTSGTACTHAEVDLGYTLATTTNDRTDGAATPFDYSVLRILDADNNIIASIGLGYEHPTASATYSFPLRIGTSSNSTDSVVAPTKRPFRVQIVESTTTNNGPPYAANGAVLFTSATFDPYNPVAEPTYEASGCRTVTGGYTGDTTPPVLTVPASFSVNTDPGANTAAVTYTAPTANDNIDGAVTPTRTAGLASGATFPLGDTIVTYRAEDSVGNFTTKSFTVTVVDNEDPVVNTPLLVTADTGPTANTGTPYFSTSANDNVDGSIPTTITTSPTTGLNSGDPFPVGTTTVTATATDSAGNVGTTSFSVVVNDTGAPVVTVPSDIVVSVDPGEADAVVSFSTSAIDNVDGTLTPTISSSPTTGLNSGDAFPVGTTTVTARAEDAAGNVTPKSFNITVNDNEIPDITVPANITTTTDPGSNTAIVNFTASAVDTVDGSITPTITTSPTTGLNSGSAFPIGTTTVSVRAEDAAGNADTKQFTITVGDGENPVFTSTQSNVNMDIPFDENTAIVSYPTPTATDNSGSVSIMRTSGLASGSTFPVGTTTITHRAEDAAGNFVDQSFDVIVARIPPGTLEVRVNSSADGNIALTSSTSAFNQTINVTGGSGTTGQMLVRPGSYAATYALPAGFVLTSSSCDSADGQVLPSLNEIQADLVSGQNIVCTLTMFNSAADTSEQVQNFIDGRARQIMGNQPRQSRRMARVNGTAPQPGGLNVLGYRAPNSNHLPVGVSVANDAIEVNYPTSQDEGLAKDWDAWAEATFSRFETDFDEGSFATLHMGVDYLITPNSILGIGASIDYTHADVIGSTAYTNGLGFMVGPYYTGEISENLYLDISAKLGRSYNNIAIAGASEDQ